jgi:hypothetical protein
LALKISICILIQGWYGQRIVENLEKLIPRDWLIKVHEFPRDLPTFIEEPEEFLPSPVSQCDLILSLGEHPAIASLLPDLAKITGAKAVIAPIDNSSWVPSGIRKHISRELSSLGVTSSFPKPFCSMKTNTGSKLIDEFAERFGRPRLRIALKDDVIESVEVLRGSPCGSTYFVAKKLLGVNRSEAATKGSLLVQTYPCLASRVRDPEYNRPLIHVTAYIVKNAVSRSLKLPQIDRR